MNIKISWFSLMVLGLVLLVSVPVYGYKRFSCGSASEYEYQFWAGKDIPRHTLPIPYPPPGDDPTIIPNEQDPYKNYLLSSSSPTLTGLRGLGGYPIPRVYVPRDQIPEKALEMTKFKEKILNTIIQTLQQ